MFSIPSVAVGSHITLIIGPTASEKTSQLAHIFRRQRIGKDGIWVMPREKSDLFPLSDEEKKVMVICDELSHIPSETIATCDFICIDDAQYFYDLLPFCNKYANAGKAIFVAARNGTPHQTGLLSVNALIPFADHLISLTADCCICGQTAAFTTQQLSSSSLSKNVPMCRTCIASKQKKITCKE